MEWHNNDLAPIGTFVAKLSKPDNKTNFNVSSPVLFVPLVSSLIVKLSERHQPKWYARII